MEVIDDDDDNDNNDDDDDINNNLFSPNIIRVIKWRRVRLTGHVARIVGEEICIRCFRGETWGKETTWKTQA